MKNQKETNEPMGPIPVFKLYSNHFVASKEFRYKNNNVKNLPLQYRVPYPVSIIMVIYSN
jgi:hypothetical protein